MNSIRFSAIPVNLGLLRSRQGKAKHRPDLYRWYGDRFGSCLQQNLGLKTLKVVEQLTAVFRKFVKNGRSTPGPKQVNHHGIHWEVIPWDKGK